MCLSQHPTAQQKIKTDLQRRVRKVTELFHSSWKTGDHEPPPTGSHITTLVQCYEEGALVCFLFNFDTGAKFPGGIIFTSSWCWTQAEQTRDNIPSHKGKPLKHWARTLCLINQALWNNGGLNQLRNCSENWSKVLDKRNKICLPLDICELLIRIWLFIWSAKISERKSYDSEDTIQNQLVISIVI